MAAIRLLFILLFSLPAFSAELRFYKLDISLSMPGIEDVHRQVTVQENQVNRINLGQDKGKKLILQVIPKSKGWRKGTAVHLECQLEKEGEAGKMIVLGKPKLVSKVRSPASVSVQTQDLPPFSLKVSIVDQEIEPIITPEEAARW